MFVNLKKNAFIETFFGSCCVAVTPPSREMATLHVTELGPTMKELLRQQQQQ